MANLGMSDTLILMVLALVVFSPPRLPQIGRQIGKLMYEFRKASNDFKFQMEEEFRKSEEAERRKKDEERQRALAAGTLPAEPAAPETGDLTSDPPLKIYPNYPIEPYPGDEDTPTRKRVSPPAVAEPLPQASQMPRCLPRSQPQLPTEPTVARIVPLIQPPSTGETVATERPGKVPRSKARGNADSEAIASGPEAERSEPAAHHG